MKVSVKKGNLADYDCEAVIAGHFEDEKKLTGDAEVLDKRCGGLLSRLLKDGDFEGKLFQTSVLYTDTFIKSKRIVFIGMGKRKDFDLETLRGVFSKAAQKVRDLHLKNFAASLDFGTLDLKEDNMAESAVEGVLLGLYRFTPYKTKAADKTPEVREFTLIAENPKAAKTSKAAAKRAETISAAVYLARDLVSAPANEMTPTIIANRARKMAETRPIDIKVFDERQMKRLGMNALLGVARGSAEPAKFIIMNYAGGRKAEKPIIFVGKGITFDSGGISIKPSANMDEMKSDMAGGAAVIGAMQALADLTIPLNVVGIVPATENLPGGKAYKPGDILKSLSGTTIEVKNTDAEGRLILADALSYAGRYKPEAIIDLATLTGACIIALGDHLIGMLGTDDTLKGMVKEAADMTGDYVWELPLWQDYDEMLKSDVADVQNVGGRAAGTITAGLFLEKFVGDYPWVHLDIAGPALLAKEKPYIPKGASGVGVRLLVQFLRNRAGKADA
ncbi:MAG: leucyl aminopeptidase [Deltaproteobacteria bacterium]|nr:leucyl aminopeptidase [Deltaproteobacteria bacterium]MBN2844911.1 leucyl aminopeptidase [Deltaproteobacteria bacterium]